MAEKQTRVRWAQEEIEALCKLWALRHARVGVGFTYKGLQKITTEAGHGFRPRTLAKREAEAFIEKYKPLALHFWAQDFDSKHAVGAQPAAAQDQRKEEPEQEETDTPQPVPTTPHSPQSTLEQELAKLFQTVVEERITEFENRITRKFLLLLEGIPGYSRPVLPLQRMPAVSTAETERKLVVVLMNAMRPQVDSVARAFPQLDIRSVEGHMPSGLDPDLVIGMVKFMSHPLDTALRKKFGKQYIRVNGASESVKVAIRGALDLKE